MWCGQLNYAVMREIYVLKLNRMFDQINSRYSVYRFLLFCVCDSNSFVFGSSQHFTFIPVLEESNNLHTQRILASSAGGVYSSLFLLQFSFSLHVQISLHCCWNWIHNIIRKMQTCGFCCAAVPKRIFFVSQENALFSHTRTARARETKRTISYCEYATTD